MKKIIVTGGCGFIGSHLSEFLTLKGYQVKVLDKYNRDNHHQISSTTTSQTKNKKNRAKNHTL